MSGFVTCPKCLSNNFAIAKLLSQRQDDNIVQPIQYFSASQEVFSLTLIITWVLTIAFFPHQIQEHPARPIIGSYNPCFGWDYAPASFIALAGCSCNVYLTWRWSFLEQTRTNLLSQEMSFGKKSCVNRFAIFTCVLLQVASNLWLLLWLIGPNDDHPHDKDGPNMRNWILHTGIFVAYGLAAYLAALGNYLEVKYGPFSDNVSTKHTVYIIVYGVAFGYLVLVYFYDLFMYEHGEDPALHPFFTQFADIVWIITFGNSNMFMPFEPPLEITTKVLTEMKRCDGGMCGSDIPPEDGEKEDLVSTDESSDDKNTSDDRIGDLREIKHS